MLDRRRASQRALVISLAVASLVLTSDAFGQVRSTIQVQARVVEAGPAWAARGAVGEALAAAGALSPAYEFSGGWAVRIDRGCGAEAVAMPRVTIAGELLTVGADLNSSGGDRLTAPQRSDAVAGASTGCPVRTNGSACARGSLPSTAVPGNDPKPRLVVTVEYVSN